MTNYIASQSSTSNFTVGPNTSLFTDHYELTMVDAALKSGHASRRSVFEVYSRQLPTGRRYGVVAGTGRFLEGLANFRFTDHELGFLSDNNVVCEETLTWLSNYEFSGNIYGYAEGETYFPYSPVLQIESSFAEACLLETYVLSVLNYDSAVASAASRMYTAAGGRSLIEMGSRRTNEYSAVAAARAAAIVGFDATSNLAAGAQYGLKTSGTAAHSFTLLYDNETQAFASQIDSMGENTTLLLDTYDVERAVRRAVEIGGPDLGFVRIDSGDLIEQASWVRELLDELGNTRTGIIVTSDLDEYAIAALKSAPVNGYGVGTRLVTGSGAPTTSMVYKLTTRQDDAGNWVDVAKTSVNKTSVGGKKHAVRVLDATGVATAEVITIDDDAALGTSSNDGFTGPDEHDPTDFQSTQRCLIRPLVLDGEVLPGATGAEGVEAARRHHEQSLAQLPRLVRRMQSGGPAIPTVFR